MSNQREHHRLVEEFLRMKRDEDPETFAEIAEKYPTLSFDQWKRTQHRERAVGLLGLEPSDIPVAVALEYGLESTKERES